MFKTRLAQKKRLRFESLEYRTLLAAGNVLAKVVGGSLFLQSDAGDDSVTVVGTATPGKYTITGNNGTTINGGASFNASGVTHNLITTFLNGNDSLAFNGATTAPFIQNVSISMGGGADSVTMGTSGTGGAFTITGGVTVVLGNGAADFVSIGNGSTDPVTIGGGVTIKLGSGERDEVIVGQVSDGISVGGSVSIILGGGFFDTVYVGDTDGSETIGGSVTTILGNGADDNVYVGDIDGTMNIKGSVTTSSVMAPAIMSKSATTMGSIPSAATSSRHLAVAMAIMPTSATPLEPTSTAAT